MSHVANTILSFSILEDEEARMMEVNKHMEENCGQRFENAEAVSWLPEVGHKIKFKEEKQAYTVRATNGVYTICTKPMNAKKTVLYTVISWLENVRGTENLVFCMGAVTDEQCNEMLQRLTSRETEVSHRNRIKLNIERFAEPKRIKLAKGKT